MSHGHARLGPSNKRWPHCPGSIREESGYEDVAGEAAIDGTGSHLLLELCLQNNVQAVQYDQQIIGTNHPDNMNGWLMAPDRIKRVQMALDYITRRVSELKTQFEGCHVTVESEQKSDPGGAFGRDDWWGTCDVTIIARHPMSGDMYFIEVADYKDGRGYVSEKNNSQNISYLFGRMRKYIGAGPDKCRPFDALKVPECRMTIIQPKTNPVVRYQCSTRFEDSISTASVIASAEKLATAANETDDPLALAIPGDHCQWCKANPKRGGHCSAQSQQSLKVVESMSDVPTQSVGDSNIDMFEYINKILTDVKSVSEFELSQLADAEAGIQSIFDKVKKEIQERIEQGIQVQGYAMVPGRASKVWVDDEESTVKKLKSRRLKQADIFPSKLISPAQLLKSESLTDVQKERIEKDMITNKVGKTSLKKVAHDHKSEKNVAQCDTDGIESDQVKNMFANVPDIENSINNEEVSFF